VSYEQKILNEQAERGWKWTGEKEKHKNSIEKQKEAFYRK